VYLAEATDDLEREHESIRDFLAEVGADVVPWRFHDARDADSLAKAIQTDLSRSIAFVQLLSEVPGRRLPTQPDTRIPAFQYSLAVEAKLPIIQWRTPTSRADIEPTHKALLLGPDVLSGPLSEFKKELISRLKELRPRAKTEAKYTSTAGEDEEDRPHNGRILTFYSYKGGTGRSMALANAAWILASHGMRVLAIDWDFEAPGLHRYYRPFLEDAELSNTPGLIDFFVNFVEASRLAGDGSTDSPATARRWFVGQVSLAPYTVSLDHEFPAGGTLDLVGAGQQDASYGLRVNSFRWDVFYEQMGGGVFLEMVKERLRAAYDYVLIDSRTGLSDTSGICTVQMPDELVVFFTLNRQSIVGAAATAASADAQRRLPAGEPALKVWPVPTRVDTSEQDRLGRAREIAREQFAPFLWHIPLSLRPDYWGSNEIQYFPYYAYEETLATIADMPRHTTSLLFQTERIVERLSGDKASRVTGSKIIKLAPYAPGERESLLARYQPTTPTSLVRFFLSFASADNPIPLVRTIATALNERFGPGAAFWSDLVPPGADFRQTIDDRLLSSDVVIVVVGSRYSRKTHSRKELATAVSFAKPVIPVKINGITRLPVVLKELGVIPTDGKVLSADTPDFIDHLVDEIAKRQSVRPVIVDIDDPNKGQFGRLSERRGRRLRASVKPGNRPEWFLLDLRVDATDGSPLNGEIEFHLHPTFKPSIARVAVSNSYSASLRVSAWGAFTVGVVADEGRTRLELDLAQLKGAPQEFRER
jgi:Mrp family chromosome partitioning ATPase